MPWTGWEPFDFQARIFGNLSKLGNLVIPFWLNSSCAAKSLVSQSEKKNCYSDAISAAQRKFWISPLENSTISWKPRKKSICDRRKSPPRTKAWGERIILCRNFIKGWQNSPHMELFPRKFGSNFFWTFLFPHKKDSCTTIRVPKLFERCAHHKFESKYYPVRGAWTRKAAGFWIILQQIIWGTVKILNEQRLLGNHHHTSTSVALNFVIRIAKRKFGEELL